MTLTLKITTEVDVSCDGYESSNGHQKIGDIKVIKDGVDITQTLSEQEKQELKDEYCEAMRDEECA